MATQIPNVNFTMAACLVFGAISPNDRWRRAHDAIKNNIFIDARSLRVQIQQEVYGIFAPDLVTGNHPNDSPLACAAEYEKKAKTADKEFGAQGRSDIEDALKAMPKVKGLVVGAFGELSSNFEAMIEGFAMEGALKRPEMFGTKDPLKAKGIISWYLKKRWSRVAVATAVQCRIDAMAYVGGRAQEEAANKHAYNQERGQWAYEQERLDREYQDSRHHF